MAARLLSPRTVTTLLIAITVGLAAPAAASAAQPSSDSQQVVVISQQEARHLNRVLIIPQGGFLAQVVGMASTPLGFRASAGEAVLAAEHNPTIEAAHRRMHPLHVTPYVWRAVHPFWYVVFTYHDKIVADAAVTPDGRVTGAWTGLQALAPYTHGATAWILSSWMVLLPASLLFLLPFLDPRRLRRMAVVDGLAVLSFLVSYCLGNGGHLVAAVWLVYPPLVYLLLRLLWIGFGRGGSSGRLAPLLSLRTLVIALPLLIAARVFVSLTTHQEIDVGYESVIGAFRALHHLPLYYNDPNHGDTYGPVTYLAYIPFELLFPWKNSLSDLHAANAASVFFDLLTILGLVLLGRRLRPGREGLRLGLILAWAWAACPFTLIGAIVHTNDELISALTVFALLAISSPVFTGGLLGLATAAKFSPAALLPLMAAPRQRGLRGTAMCVLSFAVVVGVTIFSWLPPGGLSYFWQRTLHYQLTRVDVFSPWALHPGLHPIQLVVEVLAVLLVAAVAFVPRERTLPAVCALSGAVTIAVQLPARHWFYYYIIWFLPFALVAFVAREAPAPEPAPVTERQGWTMPPAEHEPAMAGA